jgi:hypothetical protein
MSERIEPAPPTLVPRPPPRPKRHKKGMDPRLWLWPLAVAVGVALGVVAYNYLPDADFYFDYWVELALS